MQTGWIAAVALFGLVQEETVPLIATAISMSHPLDTWIAIVLVYVGVSLVAFAGVRFLRERIERWRLTAWDRHLGWLFGLAKGGILIAFVPPVVFFLSACPTHDLLVSRTGHLSAFILTQFSANVPEPLGGSIHAFVDEFERAEHEEFP